MQPKCDATGREHVVLPNGEERSGSIDTEQLIRNYEAVQGRGISQKLLRT
jgi:hypothetical protein